MYPKQALACHATYANRTVDVRCDNNLVIELLNVLVGLDDSCSIRGFCPLHIVNRSNNYSIYIHSLCNGKSNCLLDSSKVRSPLFHLCNNLEKSRNIVMLEYVCQGT